MALTAQEKAKRKAAKEQAAQMRALLGSVDVGALAQSDAVAAGGIFIGIPKGSATEQQLSHPGKTQIKKITGWGQTKLGFDPYKTGTELDQLAGYGPDEIYMLQSRLHTANLLDNFTPGKLDKATRSAFKDLLATSNASSKDWITTLDEITAAGGMTETGTTRAPLTIQLTSPDDLKAVAKKVSQTLYGGDLPDADLEHFVASYNQMETAAQTQNYNIGETGGTVTAPTDPSVALEAQVRAAHPEQVFATAIGQARNTILGTLGRGSTGVGQ